MQLVGNSMTGCYPETRNQEPEKDTTWYSLSFCALIERKHVFKNYRKKNIENSPKRKKYKPNYLLFLYFFLFFVSLKGYSVYIYFFFKYKTKKK